MFVWDLNVNVQLHLLSIFVNSRFQYFFFFSLICVSIYVHGSEHKLGTRRKGRELSVLF